MYDFKMCETYQIDKYFTKNQEELRMCFYFGDNAFPTISVFANLLDQFQT